MNIAIFLTFLRILLSPIFLIVYLQHETLGISTTALPYILLFLMIISELSDAFDGYLARRYQQVTELGKILDPMADSICHIGVLLAFTQDPIRLPLFLVFIFLYRDSIISSLRTICALKGFALAARNSGKIKAIFIAFSQITIVLMMIPHSTGALSTNTLQQTSTTLIAIAAIYALYSGVEYIVYNRHYVRKLWVKTTG